jgi:hypothetical protein
MLKRVEQGKAAKLAPHKPPKGWDKLPDLWEWLTVQTWPDSEDPRETGTIQLFVGENGLQACLNDRANNLTAFLTFGAGEENFLAIIDRKLREDTVEWRKAKTWKVKK